MKHTFISDSKEKTQEFGRFLGKLLKRGDVILLEGDLGAGKTTLTGGVAKALGIEEDISSPTFNIMKCYFKGKIPLYHIDAYRLEGQIIELGLEEYIEGDGVCLIEWPKFIVPLIPKDHLVITLRNLGGDRREISLDSSSNRFEGAIGQIKERF